MRFILAVFRLCFAFGLFLFFSSWVELTCIDEDSVVLKFIEGEDLILPPVPFNHLFVHPNRVVYQKSDEENCPPRRVFFVNCTRHFFFLTVGHLQYLCKEIVKERNQSSDIMEIIDSKLRSLSCEATEETIKQMLIRFCDDSYLMGSIFSLSIPKISIYSCPSSKNLSYLDALSIWNNVIRYVAPVATLDQIKLIRSDKQDSDNENMEGSFGVCNLCEIKDQSISISPPMKPLLFKEIKGEPYCRKKIGILKIAKLLSYKSKFAYFDLEEYFIFIKNNVDSSQCSKAEVLVISQDNGNTPIGYLLEYAKFGDLKRFLKNSDSIQPERYLYEELLSLARNIHKFREGIFHNDLKLQNIFVDEKEPNKDGQIYHKNGRKSYMFLVGDYGISVGLKRISYEDFENYDKKLDSTLKDIYFSTELISSSDWRCFGTILTEIGVHFAESKGDFRFLNIFCPLINGLTCSRRKSEWGFKELEFFFTELLGSDLENSFCFYATIISSEQDSVEFSYRDFYNYNNSVLSTFNSLSSQMKIISKKGTSTGFIFLGHDKILKITENSKNGNEEKCEEFQVSMPRLLKFKNEQLDLFFETTPTILELFDHCRNQYLVIQPDQKYCLKLLDERKCDCKTYKDISCNDLIQKLIEFVIEKNDDTLQFLQEIEPKNSGSI